jgi:hypothetical protein
MRLDRQRVDPPTLPLGERSIDQSMTREHREAREALRHDAHVEVPALARAGVARVRGAVIAHFKDERLERLHELLAQCIA